MYNTYYTLYVLITYSTRHINKAECIVQSICLVNSIRNFHFYKLRKETWFFKAMIIMTPLIIVKILNQVKTTQ